MARRNQRSFLEVVSDLVAQHPQLAAAIAFQAGALAARFVTDAPRAYKDLKREASRAPARMMEALPSLSALVREERAPKRRAAPKRRRSASRKRAARRSVAKAPLHGAPATTH